MAVEAELTATLRDPNHVRAKLAQRADVQRATYSDTYFDRPDHGMDADGYELRVRVVTTDDDRHVLLTYKEPPVDGGQGSKPEHETTAADPDVLRTIFEGLGLVELIAFEKHCENYAFTEQGRDLLATVVEIPELDGQTFLELETQAEPEDVEAALQLIRLLLAEFGVTDDDLTSESYTDRVAATRR
ncbi:class IV adenylate cyclase [Amycolatopsis sp. GM8]|uniref:class IV adenylate cyclase n=1 Tax=Amycolatopsis sp. GM8 TaxID=2896530 RepID=UPI001F3233D5|nr:class IV adenylate cyclase [Amycolatopsis sp. GM8]